MATRTVDLKDFARELGDFSGRHLDELRSATAKGIAKSIPDLVRASPVDTGLYAQSWDMTVDEVSATIGNYAPHASVIEYGMRKGHWVPLAPLLAWAKRVLKDPSQPPEYSSAVWGLARYTQKKIYDQGQLPKLILTNMIPTIISNIREEYQKL